MQRRQFITALGATGLFGAAGTANAQVSNDDDPVGSGDSSTVGGGIENIILLIGDGMGFDPIEVTSTVHGDLSMQTIPGVGYTRTHSRSGEVTDSAAAGTALATGLKAHNGQLSVYGDEEAGQDDVTPLTTQLEVAQWLGKSTGLVSTTRITHATPAAYASHSHDCELESEIADQLIESGVDVLFGGGRGEFGERTLDRAETNGYELLTDADDLNATSGEKLLGLFDDSHLDYTLDRGDSTPSLPDLTATAVDRLEQNDDGFFLMVEGGRIDHAEHGNDTQTTVAETKEFDEAVDWALDYAADRDDTLVVVTSDHETGGMATGNDYGSPIASDAIANADASNAVIAAAIEDGAGVRAAVERHVDIDLTDEDVERIEDATDTDSDPHALSNTLGAVISQHLGVAWASHTHTGPAQPVMAAGPGVDPYNGWVHHADLSATLTALLLFGRLGIVSEAQRENWELIAIKRGPRGPQDAYMALQYLGPVTGGLTSTLDLDDNGVVDYQDVVSILDGGRSEPTDIA